jgi:hypothetical protein
MYDITIYYKSKIGSYLNFEVVPENFEIVGRGIELKTDVRDFTFRGPTVDVVSELITFLDQKVETNVIGSDYQVILTRKDQ